MSYKIIIKQFSHTLQHPPNMKGHPPQYQVILFCVFRHDVQIGINGQLLSSVVNASV